MANKVIMPKQGLQMTEGTIIKWLVREGETCVKDEPLFEMETDKLTITIDSPESGALLKIIKSEGETVPITETIAVIGEKGEDISGLLAEAAPKEMVEQVCAPAEDIPQMCFSQESAGAQIFISPRAKKLAQEKGLDFACIRGTGPDGFIVEKDVLGYLNSSSAITPLAKKIADNMSVDVANISGTGVRGKVTKNDVLAYKGEAVGQERLLPITGMRQAIAVKMRESLSTSAQATVQVRVDMSECLRIRECFKQNGKKVSYNDLVVKAAAKALMDFPVVNSEWTKAGILQKDYVNIGIAVAIDSGLIVPVIKNVHLMDLEQIAQESSSLAEKAKSGQLKPDEYRGGTFTVSNLGMYKIDSFVAILNPPQSGIIAVGGIEKMPVVIDDKIEIRPLMCITLTYDHRVIDGAPAAIFTARVRDYLENPYLMLQEKGG